MILFKSLKRQKQELEELNTFLSHTIEKKKDQLQRLETKLERQSIDTRVNMTNTTVKILDLYQDSGIRIPVDILEELSYMRLVEEKDIFDYIENQRHFWTLENRKKPYRRVK